MLRTEKANQDNFKDIPSPCRFCLYWQTIGPYGEEALRPEMESKKREWLAKAAEDFGDCIKIVYINGIPAGFVQYGPPKIFPRIKEYSSGIPSEDAVVIACLYIMNREERRKGYGTTILKEIISDIKKKGFRIIETFVRKDSADNPSGPLELYVKSNFKTIGKNDDFPLVCLELQPPKYLMLLMPLLKVRPLN